MLVIPGRPQTKEDLEVGTQYRNHIMRIASRALPRVRFPDGFVRLSLELYYVQEDALERPLIWMHKSIPRADTAPRIILSALAGVLYTHAIQVNPLTVERFVLTPYQCKSQFGSQEGAVVVRWHE